MYRILEECKLSIQLSPFGICIQKSGSFKFHCLYKSLYWSQLLNVQYKEGRETWSLNIKEIKDIFYWQMFFVFFIQTLKLFKFFYRPFSIRTTNGTLYGSWRTCFMCCPFQTWRRASFNIWGSDQWNEKKDRMSLVVVRKTIRILFCIIQDRELLKKWFRFSLIHENMIVLKKWGRIHTNRAKRDAKEKASRVDETSNMDLLICSLHITEDFLDNIIRQTC